MRKGAAGAWKSRVSARLEAGTLPHAFLLTGPRGIGKGEAALWLGRAVVCERDEPPCGECDGCRSFEKLSDLDLAILRPVVRPVWIDAETLESFLPGEAAEGIDRLIGARFLLPPAPSLEKRRKVPFRLNPASLLRKGRGSPRTDRTRFESLVESSSLGDGEKRVLHHLVTASQSLEWYSSGIGIGHLIGEGEGGRKERGVLPFLGKRPAARRRKVVVVEEAEGMTEQAQNALLKTLEEPPADSLLILTSARRERLFDTIRSRCEQIRFPTLGEGAMRSALAAYFTGLTPAEEKERIDIGEGIPGRAAEVDLDEYRKEREEVAELIEAASSGAFPDYFTRLHAWVAGVEEGESPPADVARRRLDLCMEKARRLAEEGSPVSFRAADRAFLLARRIAASVRPGSNVTLLLEEFGLGLREILFRSARASRGGGA